MQEERVLIHFPYQPRSVARGCTGLLEQRSSVVQALHANASQHRVAEKLAPLFNKCL